MMSGLDHPYSIILNEIAASNQLTEEETREIAENITESTYRRAQATSEEVVKE